MKHMKKMVSGLGGFSSGASLGGKVLRSRKKQNIYMQGEPAHTLFYIQEGGVRLTARTKHQAAAVTAILGVNDFFGELCLAGHPGRQQNPCYSHLVCLPQFNVSPSSPVALPRKPSRLALFSM
jgi:CRP-like cAMP-binding protein